jgi:hypothetical protein
LRAIARESRKERNRDTAGTLCGKVTPRYPDTYQQLQENPRVLPACIGWSFVDLGARKLIFVSQLFQK